MIFVDLRAQASSDSLDRRSAPNSASPNGIGVDRQRIHGGTRRCNGGRRATG
jgi:hypothetical protein